MVVCETLCHGIDSNRKRSGMRPADCQAHGQRESCRTPHGSNRSLFYSREVTTISVRPSTYLASNTHIHALADLRLFVYKWENPGARGIKQVQINDRMRELSEDKDDSLRTGTWVGQRISIRFTVSEREL